MNEVTPVNIKGPKLQVYDRQYVHIIWSRHFLISLYEIIISLPPICAFSIPFVLLGHEPRSRLSQRHFVNFHLAEHIAHVEYETRLNNLYSIEFIAVIKPQMMSNGKL